MTVNKLDRFAENAELENVLEYTDYQHSNQKKPKGNWHQIFGNSNPIILELACGTGAYTLELARRNPGRNYIGIDIKGARIWKGAKEAEAENIHNARFLRIFIKDLTDYFTSGEVSEIWITFPDPYPKESNRHKRLTSTAFLEKYITILKFNKVIHFKTDNNNLYQYTCREVQKFGGRLIKKRQIFIKKSLQTTDWQSKLSMNENI